MKEELINLLKDKRTFIVREVFYTNINKGDEVYFEGVWYTWISGYIERTRIYLKIKYPKIDEPFDVITHQYMFLVKVK
ncbi:hypothetical protein [Buttiauxella noackiae]|uniref:hypothetical protein n=1 Tax=Buttiauxella noackiae TaxID=82992 RepID=UPI00054E8A39|nr:hypothetical protein [Buttiauxella noackiae]